MPPRRGKREAETAHLVDLKATDTVWIGIRATEHNLQRLAAYLLFAERPIEIERMKTVNPVGSLPWEDPNDPAYIAPKPAEESIDWELVKRSTTKLLMQYAKEHGEDKARAVLESYGASRLSLVPQEQLIPLNAALEAALKEKA